MPVRGRPFTVEVSNFDAHALLRDWKSSDSLPKDNDLCSAILRLFKLKATDDYVYHAIASVTLAEVQAAINHGGANGMHDWYRDDNGHLIPPPPTSDIEAYTQIFSATTSTTKALTALASNAKKGSLRASIAQHLHNELHLPSADVLPLALPAKQKLSPTQNPYLDFWAWSCHCLEWAGPTSNAVKIQQSHHILPIFYHHFGCICPSWDALSLIQQLSRTHNNKSNPARPIVEIGSGNGYWACLLRRLGLTVHAVDNALSAWRTTWIGDTIIVDGIQFLQKPPKNLASLLGGQGCSDAILLLVYPQVSNDFTGSIIRAYLGDTIVVAGTQNGNGFTGFKDETIAAWMERERSEFEKVVQIPLPSFAGKDEALFVFVRRKGGDGEGWD